MIMVSHCIMIPKMEIKRQQCQEHGWIGEPKVCIGLISRQFLSTMVMFQLLLKYKRVW